MFDRLIESESVHEDNKARRRYFVGSSIVVGLLFLTAVVFSIYAADFDIGDSGLDMTRMIAPVTAEISKPEPPKEQPRPASASNADVKMTQRTEHIANINEHQKVPKEISSVRSSVPQRPLGIYKIGPTNINAGGPGIGRTNGTGTGSGPSGISDGDNGIRAASVARGEDAPPPVAKKPEERAVAKTGGVVNGNARYLPKPPYPQPARMVGAKGNVNIQVLIDESGKVVSAKAVSGHPLLRQAAEKAAWQAKFNPTLLSGKPVKVTGVIVYKFTGI